MTRREGADRAADVLHSGRAAAGVLDAAELPVADYDDLNVSEAVAAVKELDEPGGSARDHRLRRGAQEPSARRLGGPDQGCRDCAGGRRHQLAAVATECPQPAGWGALGWALSVPGNKMRLLPVDGGVP
ncbi:hypothetical protein IWGMT90018_15650 [Mycobacterium kiyosense]|nr:hypothetical protein IWGMT90018_15650 [Mycobacterium kiyosense]